VEHQFGIVENLPFLSASFGFLACRGCSRYSKIPALGQMAQLRAACFDPSSVGYAPRNDLMLAYQNRFVNSYSADEASAVEIGAFQRLYDRHFVGTGVFISDLHLARTTSVDDLRSENLVAVLDLARDPRTMMRGFSFSDFQTRHGGANKLPTPALFELGSDHTGKTSSFGQKVFSGCLSAVNGLPDVVAAAFGGSVANTTAFCASDICRGVACGRL